MTQTSPNPLPPDTRLGHVHLTVSDLPRSLDFYQRSLGLKVHDQEGTKASLGAGGEDLLLLTEIPGAVKPPHTSGLYHFAVLTPSRPALADVLQNLIETQTPVQGFADHNVSEAIYLPDPDGNGIEVYRDRPRDEWEYDGDALRMTTDPFDFDGVLGSLDRSNGWEGMEPETVLGHMHLHVGDLDQAVNFYKDTVGLDLIATMQSAGFLSAGGYHHHLGVNTWNGVGAPPPPPGSVGLREYTVILPDGDALDQLKARLVSAGAQIEGREQGLLVKDPAGNGIVFNYQ